MHGSSLYVCVSVYRCYAWIKLYVCESVYRCICMDQVYMYVRLFIGVYAWIKFICMCECL